MKTRVQSSNVSHDLFRPLFPHPLSLPLVVVYPILASLLLAAFPCSTRHTPLSQFSSPTGPELTIGVFERRCPVLPLRFIAEMARYRKNKCSNDEQETPGWILRIAHIRAKPSTSQLCGSRLFSFFFSGELNSSRYFRGT